MFNPAPRVEAIPIAPGQTCWVIDDALAEPRRMVDYAIKWREAFADAPRNAYPGLELPLPAVMVDALAAFFSRHLRERLDARRVQRASAKLALTTQPAHTLAPRQSIPHIDRLNAEPGQRVAASVLYLFDDAALGGTSFYVPKRPANELLGLLRDAATLDADAFQARHGIAPGYIVDGNDWFERTTTVEPRFNRLIAYNGLVFHSGDIRAPDRLTDAPSSGRLTMNGFFVCSRPFGL